MLKTCSKCLKEKDISKFSWRRDNHKYRNICKQCQRIRQAKWQVDNALAIKMRKRKYYMKNRDKILQANKTYRELNCEKVKQWTRAWYMKNKERSALYGRKYQKDNPEKVNLSTRKWKRANPDKVRESNRAYGAKNSGEILARTRKRQAGKIKRTPIYADIERIKEIYVMANRIGIYLEKPMHVDHIIPLQGKYVSGFHVENNLRIVDAETNITKSNKFKVGVI